jgi:hypothetical protein
MINLVCRQGRHDLCAHKFGRGCRCSAGPLDPDLAGACKYCKAPETSGAYDWVLAFIAQLPEH